MPSSLNRIKSKKRIPLSLILFILLGVVGVVFFMKEQSKTPIPLIKERELVNQLKKKKIQRIVLYRGKNRVGIFKKERKKRPVATTPWNEFLSLTKQETPDYILPILSNENFDMHWLRIKAQLSEDCVLDYEIVESSSFYNLLLENILHLLFLLFTLFMIFGGVMRNNQLFSIGKSKAKLWKEKEGNKKTLFSDVAGLEEAKKEVTELVSFLKNPKRFLSMGARLPKGILFAGPPGTGKTLLARAVACSAQAKFYYMSGSDFQGILVGSGVARMRDLFAEARKQPCPVILFIDEIESVGKKRGGTSGAAEDRENTLNTLLTEMDGIEVDRDFPVMIIGATNFPERLDSALLRRLERKVIFELPALKDREQIFRKHLERVKKSKRINFTKLAEQTAGFSGSDIASACNEAAIHAVITKSNQIVMADLDIGIDRIATGRERKSKIMTAAEKMRVAVHESGHAIACWFHPLASPLLKLTIIPRMRSLGHLQQKYPEQYICTEEELRSKIFVALGGRVAEQIEYKNFSTGAENDLAQLTEVARDIIIRYGMNKKVGYVSYNRVDHTGQFLKPYAEATGELIDQEIRSLVHEIYKEVQKLLTSKKKELAALTKLLLKKESLGPSEVEAILGDRPKQKEKI